MYPRGVFRRGNLIDQLVMGNGMYGAFGGGSVHLPSITECLVRDPMLTQRIADLANEHTELIVVAHKERGVSDHIPVAIELDNLCGILGIKLYKIYYNATAFSTNGHVIFETLKERAELSIHSAEGWTFSVFVNIPLLQRVLSCSKLTQIACHDWVEAAVDQDQANNYRTQPFVPFADFIKDANIHVRRASRHMLVEGADLFQRLTDSTRW